MAWTEPFTTETFDLEKNGRQINVRDARGLVVMSFSGRYHLKESMFVAGDTVVTRTDADARQRVNVFWLLLRAMCEDLLKLGIENYFGMVNENIAPLYRLIGNADGQKRAVDHGKIQDLLDRINALMDETGVKDLTDEKAAEVITKLETRARGSV